MAGPALRADEPAVVVAEPDPVDVLNHEVLDESVARDAVVHVDLTVPGDLPDLAIVLVPAPAVGADTLGGIVGGLLDWTREEG